MANIDLFVVDDLDIHDKIVQYVENNINETLYPGDERKIFLEILNGWTVEFLTTLNEKFNQRFAQFARGKILDAHGENENCPRLEKKKATITERFSVGAPLSFNVVIPQKTRVTADKEKYFETKKVSVIMAGDTSVDVLAEAEFGGVNYNGYEVGKINCLVDQIDYISTVTNLTESSGGDDGEPYPDEDDGIGDEHYYQRIRLAKSSKSTAGAESTYEYYAKSADPSISDVKVTTPEPGKVKLIVSCKDGKIPSEDILKKVVQICSSKEVRPLGDKVKAIGTEIIPYDIELTYYTTPEEESSVVTAIEGEGGAIERYNAWQVSGECTAINPDRLRAEILKSDIKPIGAYYVEITKPIYTSLNLGETAKWSGKISIKHSTTSPAKGQE